MVPRRCRWPLRAKSSSPALAECIGRGPTGFRAVAGKIRPVTGTCRKRYINTKRTENNQDIKPYDTYRLTSWCDGKAHLRWRTTFDCEGSYSDQGRSCPAVLGQNVLVPLGKVVPRRCRWHLRAQSGSPALAECIGRGPTRFRAMAGKIRPVTGTCRKI